MNNKTACIIFLLNLIFIMYAQGKLMAQLGLPCNQQPVLRVSPVDEITILDPQVNSMGKPEAQLFQDGSGQQVSVSQSVVIHKYYYSGDREFRGPSLPGGPSIVVLKHPETHERLYLEVELMPGSPLVVYRKNYLEYDYGTQQIRISFDGPLDIGKPYRTPKISYRDNKHGKLVQREEAKNRTYPVLNVAHETGVSELAGTVVHGTGEAIHQSATVIRKTGEFVVTPVKKIVNATPVGSLFNGESQRIEQQRDRAVQAAARQKIYADQDYKTLR